MAKSPFQLIVQMTLTVAVIYSYAFFIARDAKLDRVLDITNYYQEVEEDEPLESEKATEASRWKKIKKNRQREEKGGSFVSEQVERSVIKRSRLPDRLVSSVFWYYKVTYIIAICLAIKYIIICTLNSNNSLKPYRFLLCFIPGRVVLDGRVVGFTNYFVCFVLCTMIAWRTIMLIVRPKFKFYFIEFLLHDCEEILDNELRHSALQSSMQMTNGLALPYGGDTAHRSIYDDQPQAAVSQSRFHKILEFRDLFNEKEVIYKNGGFPVRPNRTLGARSTLVKRMFLFLGFNYLAILCFAPVFARMVLPILYTEYGFTLAYSGCVQWIVLQSKDYSYIYHSPPPSTLAPYLNLTTLGQAFIPFGDSVELTAYHVMRILWDVAENALVYIDTFNSYSFPIFLAIMQVNDVLIYSAELNKQLAALIKRLSTDLPPVHFDQQQQQQQQQQHRTSLLDVDFQSNRLQSMLTDLLALIRSCNNYAACFTLTCVLMWFTYSAVVCSWMFIPGSITETNKLEWYTIQLVAALYSMTILGYYSVLRSSCRRTYILINSLIARDSKCIERKRRWLALAQHYYPKPLYCFTLFDSIELSWLANLKIVTWHVAALFVASTFFTAPHGVIKKTFSLLSRKPAED